MKIKYLFYLLCITIMLTGCSFVSSLQKEDSKNTWNDSDYITIGSHLTIQNTDNSLTLLNNMDTLAADGLYYASWTMGNTEPYENSDGDTVDLYDAQLYLLLEEAKNEENAQNILDNWFSAGKNNYEVLNEEEIACNGQSYTLLTYNCINEDNPYARGISAFSVFYNNAVCIELTCREAFEGELRTILLDFLNSCTYNTD